MSDNPVSNNGTPIPLTFINSIYAKEFPGLVKEFLVVANITIPITYYQYGYTFVSGVNLFLGFLSYANKHLPESRQIYLLEDCDIQTFISFFNWAMKKDIKHYGWLKSMRVMLNKAHNENPKMFKKLSFPALRRPKIKHRESLSDDAVNQLIDALKKNVNEIIVRQELREKWLSEGTPLDLEPSFFTDNYCLENVCFDFKQRFSEGLPPISIKRNGITIGNPKLSSFRKRIKQCTDKRVAKLTIKQFVKEYESNNWEALSDKGRPCINSFKDYQFKIKDAAKTVYESNYLFSSNKSELTKIHSDTCKTLRNNTCVSPIHMLIRRFRTGLVKPSTKSPCYPLVDSDISIYTDFLAELYPTSDELIVILMFIMLQTGWNLETALGIDINMYEHAISKSVDSDIAILVSKKRRGANGSTPYTKEKTILAPSDTTDKYSAYNLYRLLFRVTSPLRHGEAYEEIIKEIGYEPAFVFLIQHYSTKVRIIDNFSGTKQGKTTSRKVLTFLENNPIFESGERILKKNHLLQRLRPTWVRLKKKSGASRASITMLMGHSDHETKDIHYDNSTAAAYERKERGGKELNAIDSSIRDHSFRGTLVPLKSGIKSYNSDKQSRDGHIFVDDENDRLISLCNDSLSPDWPGFESRVKEDQRCLFVQKCLFCSQSRITVDTLPYLIDRARYIDTQQRTLNRLEFTKLYSDEQSAIEFILESWPNTDDIDKAEVYVDINGPLLPSDLQIPGIGGIHE